MGKLVKAALVAAVVALALVTAALAASSKGTASDTLVYAASSDPVSLDPAVTSDGESSRAQLQIFETLVAQVPGTTKLTAGLAVGWKLSNGGKTWTFKLRRNVRFHDGTSFDASAVCANFNRWYNFRGALQSDSASYYYNVIFGGFAHPEKGAPGPGKALYRNCQAKDANTAVINIKRRFAPFAAAMTLTPFAMQSPTAMTKYGADKGKLTSDGVFVPLGTYGAPGGQAVGTGPFKLESWKIGDKLELVRNDSYWGKKAFLRRVILRAISDNTARLQALQTGEIQGYDNVEPQDIATIRRSSKLKIVDRPAFNVGYVTINQAVKPFDDIRVRQAVAYGLDRAKVVKSFYLGRGIVAQEFQPPTLRYGYSSAVKRYPYNPAKAKQLLQQAGLTLPVEVEFWYPSDVSRPYMPDPKRNFQGFAASLNESGFKVVAKTAPWRPDYLGKADSGTAGALNLLGWTGDFSDPESFLGSILRAEKQFGLDNKIGKKLYADLDAALAQTNADAREGQYRKINNYIMANVIGVPYVNTQPALGFAKNVIGYKASPTLTDLFVSVRVV